MHVHLYDSDDDHARLVATQVRLLDAAIRIHRIGPGVVPAEVPDALLGDLDDADEMQSRAMEWFGRVPTLLFTEAEELERPQTAALPPGTRLIAFGDFPGLVQLLRAGFEVSAPAAPPLPELTDREREILILLAGGHANKVIAQKLDISHRTVMNHVNNLYRKLGVNNRLEAVHRALKAGLAKLD